MVAALAVEFVLIRQELTRANRAPALSPPMRCSAPPPVLLLVIGLLRVFYFEKGAAYYFSSHAFLTKFSVFIALGLLSIIPTVEFLSWRKALKAGSGAGAGRAERSG